MNLDFSELKQDDKRIYWSESVGCNIYLYDNHADKKIIKIIGYANETLSLKFNEKNISLRTESMKHGGISKLFKPDKYYKTVGDTVESKTGEQKIVDIKSKGEKKKMKTYKLECQNCGREHVVDYKNYIRGSIGCEYCMNKKADERNCLLTTHPELDRFVVDKKMMEEVTAKSHKKIECVCPKCGKHQFKVVTYLANLGFYCEDCNPVIRKSFPQKFVYNFLKEETNLDIDFEKKFEWSKNPKTNHFLRYDLYIPKLNMIIEVHGNHHYRQSKFFQALEKVQAKDRLKYQLAKGNGIEHYVVVDASSSNPKFLRESICNNVALQEIIDEFKIDINDEQMWNEIHQKSKKT